MSGSPTDFQGNSSLIAQKKVGGGECQRIGGMPPIRSARGPRCGQSPQLKSINSSSISSQMWPRNARPAVVRHCAGRRTPGYVADWMARAIQHAPQLIVDSLSRIIAGTDRVRVGSDQEDREAQGCGSSNAVMGRSATTPAVPQSMPHDLLIEQFGRHQFVSRDHRIPLIYGSRHCCRSLSHAPTSWSSAIRFSIVR